MTTRLCNPQVAPPFEAGTPTRTTPLTRVPTHKTIIDIQTVSLALKRKGLEPTTRRTIEHCLKALAKKANLNKPLEIADTIADYQKRNGQPASNGFKRKLCNCYNYYVEHFKLEWEKPSYKYEERGIQPPTNQKILQLIAGAKEPLSTKIQVAYETGLRPIEIQSHKGLRVKDFHPDQKTITALNTKRCNARPPMPTSIELTTRLKTHIEKNKLQPEDYLFPHGKQTLSEQIRHYKIRLANKLNDPAIKSIRLYDPRHAYVTRQLRRIQNAEAVRIIVGHKTLSTTQKYLHLLGFKYGECIVEGTTYKERAKQLFAKGFTYQLIIPDGAMLFHKPK